MRLSRHTTNLFFLVWRDRLQISLLILMKILINSFLSEIIRKHTICCPCFSFSAGDSSRSYDFDLSVDPAQMNVTKMMFLTKLFWLKIFFGLKSWLTLTKNLILWKQFKSKIKPEETFINLVAFYSSSKFEEVRLIFYVANYIQVFLKSQ